MRTDCRPQPTGVSTARGEPQAASSRWRSPLDLSQARPRAQRQGPPVTERSARDPPLREAR